MPSWTNVRTQVAAPLVTVWLLPAPQVTATPLSKKETVPPLALVLSLVFFTVAVMVLGAETAGGVRVTEVGLAATVVVVAAAATPVVVIWMVQPPPKVNVVAAGLLEPPLLTVKRLQVPFPSGSFWNLANVFEFPATPPCGCARMQVKGFIVQTVGNPLI